MVDSQLPVNTLTGIINSMDSHQWLFRAEIFLTTNPGTTMRNNAFHTFFLLFVFFSEKHVTKPDVKKEDVQLKRHEQDKKMRGASEQSVTRPCLERILVNSRRTHLVLERSAHSRKFWDSAGSCQHQSSGRPSEELGHSRPPTVSQVELFLWTSSSFLQIF